MCTAKRPAIVFDNGSHTIKAGFSSEDLPHIVVSRRDLMHRNFGVRNGLVTCCQDQEAVWAHFFKHELKADPQEHAVMLSEVSMASRKDRENVARIMFESFHVPELYIANHGRLALYECHKDTGIAVLSGHQVTESVPVIEGRVLKKAVQRMSLNGDRLSEYLVALLSQHTSSSFLQDAADNIKHKHLVTLTETNEYARFIKFAHETDINSQRFNGYPSVVWKDPIHNASLVVPGPVRLQCVEAMFGFDAHLYQKTGHNNIATMTLSSAAQCERHTRSQLLQNIVLSGGNAMFKNFGVRLENEMTQMLRDKNAIDGYLRQHAKGTVYGDLQNLTYSYCAVHDKLHCLDRSHAVHVYNKNSLHPYQQIYKYNVWSGGSLLASWMLDNAKTEWISREEYDDVGPSIVHRKCI